MTRQEPIPDKLSHTYIFFTVTSRISAPVRGHCVIMDDATEVSSRRNDTLAYFGWSTYFSGVFTEIRFAVCGGF